MALAAALLLATACSRDAEPRDPVVTLQGATLAQGDYLGRPSQIAVVGERLVVLDRSAPFVHVLRAGDGQRLSSFGKDGGGPGEFRNAEDVQADPDDPDAFWILDGNLGRMTRLTLGTDTAPALGTMVNLHDVPGVHLQSLWLNDSTLALSGIYPSQPRGRLLTADRAGRLTGTIGALPQHPGAPAIPVSVLRHAYEGRMAVRPDHERLAFATRNADQLEIYRADGSLVRAVTGGAGFLPVFEVNYRPEGAGMATGDDLRVGYLDLASTSRHLYALYSGKTRAESRGRTYFGKEVHVYDWNGERLATLALPELAFTLTVDPAGRYLYAVHHDPEPRVARYTLPANLRGRMAAAR